MGPKFSQKKTHHIFIGLLLTFGVLFSVFTIPVKAETINVTKVAVFSKKTDTILLSALRLDSSRMKVEGFITPESLPGYNFSQFDALLSEVDVILVDRFLPANISYLHRMVEYINGSRATHGLIMFGVLNGTAPQSQLQLPPQPPLPDLNSDQVPVISPILPVELTPNYTSSTNDSTRFDFKIQTKLHESIQEDEFYLQDIPWTSVGAISYRTVTAPKPSATPILVSIEGEYSLISEWTPVNEGTTMFFSMEITEENLGFTRWPYFNYLIMACTLHANPQLNDSAIPGYADWEYSPVPKGSQIVVWFGLVGTLWIASFFIYFTMRKKTREDPKYNQVKNDQQPEVSET